MHRANRPVTPPRHTARNLQQRPSGRLLLALACSLALQQLPGVALAADNAPAQQQGQQIFAIAAGPLAPALRSLSSSANLLLSFTAEQTADKVTAGLQGHYTVPEALAALLAGTGLQAVQVEAGGYVLRPAPAPTNNAAAHTELPAMTISGKASRYQSSVPVSSATRSDADALDVPQTADAVPDTELRDRGARSIKEDRKSTR